MCCQCALTRALKDTRELGRTSPAPAGVLEHRGGDIRANERVDDEGRGGESRDESTPLESRDVRDDDGRQQLQAARERSAMLYGIAACTEHSRVSAVNWM